MNFVDLVNNGGFHQIGEVETALQSFFRLDWTELANILCIFSYFDVSSANCCELRTRENKFQEGPCELRMLRTFL